MLMKLWAVTVMPGVLRLATRVHGVDRIGTNLAARFNLAYKRGLSRNSFNDVETPFRQVYGYRPRREPAWLGWKIALYLT
jgi:hypothetical protein